MSEHLFVYGTLLTGVDNEYSRLLNDNATLIGEAKLQGRLYQISWYPGAVKSNDSNDWIYGQLFEISSSSPGLMKELDYYEGVGEPYEKPYEYAREIAVVLQNEKEIESWIYWYNGDSDGKPWIKTGNFLDVGESDFK